MKLWKIAACLPLVFAGATAMAEPTYAELEPVLKSNTCLACHTVDKKIVGPSYKEVFEKYNGEDGAAEQLVQSMLKGSGGTWGAVAMPPNVMLKQEQAEQIAAWILAGANQ